MRAEFDRPHRKFTVDEYFSLEEQASERSEFLQGELFAMTGGTLDHNRILNNLARTLAGALSGGECEVFTSDVRLHVAAHNLFTYPDLMVVCGEPQFYPKRSDTITAARVVIEILSPSTEAYDKGPKSDFYRSLPSLEQLLLVEQSAPGVYSSVRHSADSWLTSHLPLREGTVELPSLKLTLSVSEIYENVFVPLG